VELITITKDKQGRPVAQVDISPTEAYMIRFACVSHPKHKSSDPEGMRFRALAVKTEEELRKLTNINIQDIKEAINKHNQTMADPDRSKLYNELHEIWKTLNPS
jgi:hypothetical protein